MGDEPTILHSTITASLATSLLAAMSAQQLELAVLYAYNPPGVGEEAAGVKAQVCACEALHYGYRQIVETQQAPRSCRRGLLWPTRIFGRCSSLPGVLRHTRAAVSRKALCVALYFRVTAPDRLRLCGVASSP